MLTSKSSAGAEASLGSGQEAQRELGEDAASLGASEVVQVHSQMVTAFRRMCAAGALRASDNKSASAASFRKCSGSQMVIF